MAALVIPTTKAAESSRAAPASPVIYEDHFAAALENQAQKVQNIAQPRLSSLALAGANVIGDLAAQPLLSSLALAGADVIGDLAALERNADAAYVLMHTGDPSIEPVIYHPLGFPTTFNAVTGPLKALDGYSLYQTSVKTNDVCGQRLGVLKGFDGVATAVGGLCYIPVRIINTLRLISPHLVPVGVLAGAGVVSIVGLWGFIASSGAGAVATGRRAHEARLILDAMDLTLNHADTKKFGLTRHQVCLSHTLGSPLRDPESAEGARMRRVLDDGLVEEVLAQSSPSPKEAEVLVTKVQADLNKKFWLSVATCALCLLTAVAFTVFALPGVGLPLIMAASIAVIGTSAGWLALDGYQLVQAFKNHNAGKHDRMWMMISSVVLALSLVACFLVGGGLPSALLASIVAALWLIVHVACYVRMSMGYPKTEQLMQALKAEHYHRASRIYQELRPCEQEHVAKILLEDDNKEKVASFNFEKYLAEQKKRAAVE